jgi:uncharacterized protein YjbJ (UPF0337 family)
MTDKHVDDAKGRVKEAAGALSGDQDLKNEGKTDQAKSKLKDRVDRAADKVVEETEKLRDRVTHR